jgi:hypothetical protein
MDEIGRLSACQAITYTPCAYTDAGIDVIRYIIRYILIGIL